MLLLFSLAFGYNLSQLYMYFFLYAVQVKVAAFAVSAYVTAFHRPARKPFNPILGETYEWVREDKGFKFMAEQVRGREEREGEV